MSDLGTVPHQLTHHKLTTSGLSEKHRTWQFVQHQEHWSLSCASGCQYIPAQAVPRGVNRAQPSTAAMTLFHGVMSTNRSCTAAPSFSCSDQTLIVPYFVRYIYIYICVFIYLYLSFISQLSIRAKPVMDLKKTSLSPLLSGLELLKWLVA